MLFRGANISQFLCSILGHLFGGGPCTWYKPVSVGAVVLLFRAGEVSRYTSLVASLSTEWSPYLMALAKTEPVPMAD